MCQSPSQVFFFANDLENYSVFGRHILAYGDFNSFGKCIPFPQAEKVYNQDLYYKKTVKYVGEPMTHLESIASYAVTAASGGEVLSDSQFDIQGQRLEDSRESECIFNNCGL
ncbi:hypothetical protein POM88_028585 [Heracleum sosnowskyi]|uniref:Uncharacterized protein n=1 Tax=Heracleum sosnowskyi TaxID=360622 RepID=A0AAD8MGV4_9APIA|nr:hypothetical protein POM88_028585 [Heracleum sosnowskyi]